VHPRVGQGSRQGEVFVDERLSGLACVTGIVSFS